jgi:guanylate kinase
LRFSVSHTSRAPRAGEVDAIDYHFVDREAFAGMAAAGEFLEWAEVYGNLYGTHRGEVDRAREAGQDLLLDIDVQGARSVRRAIPTRSWS